MLLLLAALWGASYLFIKVAIEDIEPAPMMTIRLLGAAVPLLAYVIWRLGRRTAVGHLRRAWRATLVLGVINAALPFWLIAWGEKHIDSSVAAIAQATVPIFVLLLGLRFLPQERITAALLFGGLLLFPFALLQVPDHLPSWKAAASLAALTLLGTALAQLILYRILALHGSAKLSLVTYLMPGFAVVYGALLLDEPITAGVLLGLFLILAGVAVASGKARLGRAAVAEGSAR